MCSEARKNKRSKLNLPRDARLPERQVRNRGRPPPLCSPSPVSDKERVEAVDVLRGFALLGILAMNIRAMAAPFGAYMTPSAFFPYEGASRAAYIFTSIVFDLKMMGLFSMLFGAGVLLYAGKSADAGRSPRALWFRRMFWLLVIGLVHAYLIWDGDILVPYALCGSSCCGGSATVRRGR